MENTTVMKFGGASVATPDHFSNIAQLIAHRLQTSKRIAIVISAMGGTTDHLISLAKQVNPEPPQREYDMLVSVGERISMALLAMALAKQGIQAISFTGSQAGIITCPRHTDARIIDVKPKRLLPVLDEGKVIIVAGFQGVSQQNEITTLGRGGSDTTAVALGVALQAPIEFYKDVKGIYTEDPKKNPEADLIKNLSYDQALDIVRRGAKVLHPRCIELARKNNIPLHVRSFNQSSFNREEGTTIGEFKPICMTEPRYEDV